MPEFSMVTAAVLISIGLCSTLLLVPPIIKLAHRIGAVDRGGYRKVFEGAMPMLGGLSMALPVIGICLVACLAGLIGIRHWEWVALKCPPEYFNQVFSILVLRKEFAVLALGSIAILALGLYDDLRGLRPRHKLAGQIFIAFLFCIQGYVLHDVKIPFLGRVGLPEGLGYLITVLWIVGLINALNLIDGIDGLAAGTTCIISLGLVTMSFISGNIFMTIVCATLAGVTLGFLRYNFYPARLFMGDTGSMFLGFMLASVTLLGASKARTAYMVLAPLLALGFPISEMLISMIRRFLQGKPIFSGDQRHTHHRLLKLGYSQKQAVLLLYGVTLLFSIAATLSRILASSWIPITLYAVTIVGIVWIAGYLRPESFLRLSQRRQRIALFRSFCRYAILRLNTLENTCDDLPEILDLARKQFDLRFLAVWQEEGERLIASSGEPENKGPMQYDAMERLRIKSPGGFNVVVKFQFRDKSTESRIIDVSASLASLFENARITLPPASIVEMVFTKKSV